MFQAYPAYDRNRALGYVAGQPEQHGEDVFALQTGLNFVLSVGLQTDGILGPKTGQHIEFVQKHFRIKIDGRCGPITWVYVTDYIARKFRNQFGIAIGLMYGQLGHESTMRGGMYSSPPRKKKDRPNHPNPLLRVGFDAGVAQLNSDIYSLQLAFEMPSAIELLAQNTKAAYRLFEGVATERRRWGLAAGNHNAPAWAKFIAREEGATKVNPSDTATPDIVVDEETGATGRQKLEQYIRDTTLYLKV